MSAYAYVHTRVCACVHVSMCVCECLCVSVCERLRVRMHALTPVQARTVRSPQVRRPGDKDLPTMPAMPACRLRKHCCVRAPQACCGCNAPWLAGAGSTSVMSLEEGLPPATLNPSVAMQHPPTGAQACASLLQASRTRCPPCLWQQRPQTILKPTSNHMLTCMDMEWRTRAICSMSAVRSSHSASTLARFSSSRLRSCSRSMPSLAAASCA